MKKKLFFVGVLIALFGVANAQVKNPSTDKKKPEAVIKNWDVLVIGNGNAAVAAAIQSAASGVNTAILLQAGGFDVSLDESELNSGFKTDFLKKFGNAALADSLKNESFFKLKGNTVLKGITDTIKKLKVIRNVVWVKATRSGNNWNFKLSDGSTIKPKVLINTYDSKLNETLKIATPAAVVWNTIDYNNNLYRTSVATGKSVNGNKATFFSLYQLFVPNQENFVWVSDPQSMALGQAAGATAAYAAFFDTKTSLSNLKTIQGELINYKLNIMPFADVNNLDTNRKAIQFIGVTGVIKADLDGKVAKFAPDKMVATSEVKQPIKDLFYKAQIWFDDYKDPKMTIGATIDMVCYVGNKSVEATKKELEKKWKTTYQFKSDMDLTRQINRREFAVILQDYMPPFNVNVDRTGRVIR